MFWYRLLVRVAILAAVAVAASAATVTLDLNGFANTLGGQVTGPGLASPIPIPPGAQRVVLEDLQAEQTYQVDFFHDQGGVLAERGSGDFTFLVAADGQGVDSVGLGGGRFPMVDGFKEGDRTLKLKTWTILYNANSAQTGEYYIHGLIGPLVLKPGSGPQQVVAIPGNYIVDNLYNSNAGREDFIFVVDAGGNVRPTVLPPLMENEPESVSFRTSEEHAEFIDNEVRPRAVPVHFHVEATDYPRYHTSHPATNVVANGGTVDLDLLMPVGGGGLNIWWFGANEVTGGTLVRPDGRPALGTTRNNDFYFRPLLRYDLAKKMFYFVTTEGPSQTVTGEAQGFAEDQTTPFAVKVIATIVPR